MTIEYPKARFSPAKGQFIVVEFKRDEIEHGDLRRVYDILSGLTETKEAADFGEGQLLLFFSGWDEDPPRHLRHTRHPPLVRAADREVSLLAALRREAGRHADPHAMLICHDETV